MGPIWTPTDEVRGALERAPPRAQARVRRLREARALLAGGAGAVLAGGDRGHGPRVLAAVGRRGGHVERPRVGNVVRRRQAQPRRELRPPLGSRGPGRRRSSRSRQSEDGERQALTYRELSDAVTRLAEALAALGVGPGDRVAIFLPMSPQVAVASHACAHLGAIQVPVFSGFAAPAIAARLRHAEAKVVVTADGSLRRGREVPMKALVDEALTESPSVEHVVVWRRLGHDDVPMLTGRDSSGTTPWRTRPASSRRSRSIRSTPTCSPTPRARPARRRACFTSRAASWSRSRARSPTRRTRSPDDVIHFVTDMGWIMGPWEVVGGMALGCTIVFAEGAPDWPAADRLWGLVESERVSILGLSPTLMRALIPHGAELVERHDLSSLRVLVTTGRAVEPGALPLAVRARRRRPLPDHQLLRRHRGRCLLPLAHASRRRSSRARSAGRRSGWRWTWSTAEGRSVRGEVGELVCRRAVPRDDARLLARPRALPRHVLATPARDLGARRLGLRRRGRLLVPARPLRRHAQHRRQAASGPAELESAVVAHPSVAEAAAVGVPHEVKGEVAWVFCALVPGAEPSDELAAELRAAAADELGKAFAPGARAVRLGAAEDAQCEDRQARGAREGARRGSRRPLVPGEPRDPGGDRACRSRLTASTDRSPSSPAAAAGSAPESRESSPDAGAHVAVAARTRAQVEQVARRDRGRAARGRRHRPGVRRRDGRPGRARARADRPARRQRRHRRAGRRDVGGRSRRRGGACSR